MEDIKQISARDLAYSSYAEYAKYVNLNRAIPAIGDGLIPVYRRVLLAAAKYSELTLSNSIISDTNRDYHGHGSVSIEPVLSRLVRNKLLNGKGNHGLKLMEEIGHAAPRYTKAGRNDDVNKVLLRLKEYSPSVMNEFGVNEPTHLTTPIPLALVFGHFNIGIGVNSVIPAFTYGSLLRAYRANNYKLLVPQYGYDLGEGSELKELWETGYGRVEYKMQVTHEWSESDGCNVTIIEGSGEVFRPNLKELDEHLEQGRIWMRSESTKSIRLVIGRTPRVRAITDDEIYEIVKKGSTYGKVYDLKVQVGSTVRRVGIKDWLDVTHGLYDEAHKKWQVQEDEKFRFKMTQSLLIPILVEAIGNNATDEELLELANQNIGKVRQWFSDVGIPYQPESITEEDISEMMSMPIRRLRNHDLNGTLDKLRAQWQEVQDFDTERAVDDAAKVIVL